jgi:hypothetical protein
MRWSRFVLMFLLGVFAPLIAMGFLFGTIAVWLLMGWRMAMTLMHRLADYAGVDDRG